MAAQTHIDVKEAPLPGCILLAMYDFTAMDDDYLRLDKGDLIELVNNNEDYGDGWYLGRKIASEKVGLFPRAYTKVLPRTPCRMPKTVWQETEHLFESLENVRVSMVVEHKIEELLNTLEINTQPRETSPEPPCCGICLNELVNAYALPCGDVFCERCISRWLEENMTCPLDRQPVPADVKEDLDNCLAPPPAYNNSPHHANGHQSDVESVTASGSPCSTSPPTNSDRPHQSGPSSSARLTTQADTSRPTISWPLERIHGVPRHTAAGFLTDQECGNFWRHMKELGRLSQKRRQPIRQPGAIAAVRG